MTTSKPGHKKWKPRCLVTDTGIVYDMDRVKPQDLLDDVSCAQFFGSTPPTLEQRVELFRAHRRATFAADRVLTNLCTYARDSEFQLSKWVLKKL